MPSRSGPVLASLAALSLLAAPADAQLADLQPGRNFPTASEAFGAGRSENLEVGDVDRDGDLDVVVANGGEGSAQDNALYLNAAGAQGGVAGSFLDVSATALAGQVAERSRDVELVDWDGDFDLDLFDASGGSVVSSPVQRAYVNQGGLQLGSLGRYLEGTDGFWGTLVSIPPGDEVGVVDGAGPFGFVGCLDADFGDLDDDGDLDLFLSSPGLSWNGTEDTRVFLNDGAGRFDELWPWADAGADTKVHTMDIDLVDLDGDVDLDAVASSRDSPARVYRNTLRENGWAVSAFVDVTSTAIGAQSAWPVGTNNYETEYADLDGDDDFDLWMVNYDGFRDRLLVNDGALALTRVSTLHKGDPDEQEYEVDFLDYDGDGDLDVFLANFSGTNTLYQSGLADGLTPAQGLYHRSGTSSGGSLSWWPETPASGNGGTSLDGECFDMDGDGDPDILLANDINAANRYWENVLGVPDTHAPRLLDLTVQGDKSDGSPTPIHVRVMDNASSHEIRYADARLCWSLDGGPESCVPMLAQGGQLFRGEIPAGLTGSVGYRVEVTDLAGNLAVSATTTYQQSGGAPDVWLPVDQGTTGELGRPLLVIEGSGVAGESVFLQLVDGAPESLALFLAGLSSTPLPFKGGLLYPVPWDVEVFLPTDAGGMVNLLAPWPAGLPVGQQAWFQFAVADGVHPSGVALSQAVVGTQP